jgi:hypothetical protein
MYQRGGGELKSSGSERSRYVTVWRTKARKWSMVPALSQASRPSHAGQTK